MGTAVWSEGDEPRLGAAVWVGGHGVGDGTQPLSQKAGLRGEGGEVAVGVERVVFAAARTAVKFPGNWASVSQAPPAATPA